MVLILHSRLFAATLIRIGQFENLFFSASTVLSASVANRGGRGVSLRRVRNEGGDGAEHHGLGLFKAAWQTGVQHRATVVKAIAEGAETRSIFKESQE